MQRNRNLKSSSPSSGPQVKEEESLTSFWYDSKATSNLSVNIKYEEENAYSRDQNLKAFTGSMLAAEEKRQPLRARNLNQLQNQSNTDLYSKKNSTNYGRGLENKQSYNTEQASKFAGSKNLFQSDRYEKKLNSTSDRLDKFQKLELTTPSPSPPKSSNEFQHQDRSELFQKSSDTSNRNHNQSVRSRFQENSRSLQFEQTKLTPYEFQDDIELANFPYPSRQAGLNTQTERGRTTILQSRQPTGNFLKRTSSNHPRKFSKSGSQNPAQKIKKPPNKSAGDWICTGCWNVNFARRIDCNICSMPKPYTEILKTPISQIGPQGLFKDTDWQCFNCRNVNFQRRQNCNKCNEPKPEEYIQRERQVIRKRKPSKKPKNSVNPMRPTTNPFNKIGSSKNSNLISNRGTAGRMQNQPPQLHQNRYSYSNSEGIVSNGVPFNHRPVQRVRSRSASRK